MTGLTSEVQNASVTLLSSEARTGTIVTPVRKNAQFSAARFTINVTAVPGVDVVTPIIQGVDPLSGAVYNVLVGLNIILAQTVVMRVGPRIEREIPNLTMNDLLPSLFQVTMLHSGAGSFTYSVNAELTV